jgi:hypothetical protein
MKKNDVQEKQTKQRKYGCLECDTKTKKEAFEEKFERTERQTRGYI